MDQPHQRLTRHNQTVSKLFYCLSAAVGLPSLLGTLLFGVLSFLAWWQRPAPVGNGDAKVSESLVNVIVAMANGAAQVLSKLLGFAEGLLHLLTGLSLAGLALAAFLLLIGRGLDTGAVWARLAASAFLLLSILVSLLCTLSAGLGSWRLLALTLLLGSGYALWITWRGIP